MIRILIADDCELVRLGLRRLVEHENGLELAGEAASFAETRLLAEQVAPDVVLLDLTLSDGFILDRIPELLDSAGQRKILVLTGDRDKENHRLALRLGAVGVVGKDQPAAILPKAIRRVHAGEVWIDRSMTATLFRDLQRAANPAPAPPAGDRNGFALTCRERQIAILAAQGLPAKRIAQRCRISDKTVRNQLVAVYSKLNLAGQLELAAKAGQLGLAPDQ